MICRARGLASQAAQARLANISFQPEKELLELPGFGLAPETLRSSDDHSEREDVWPGCCRSF
jgi:hypothetical protein